MGLIVISSVSATPGDICTTHSQCEAGEYCYDAGACSQCFDNNACSIYGNSIDGDCSKCSTPNYYCVTACMTSVNDNSCGDNNGQTHECVSYLEAAISNLENVANSYPANAPAGFLGCTSSACNTLCTNSGVTDVSPIAFMSASNTWCLLKDKTMWMNADQANTAAISRGCSGSHEMNGMYMHGNTHMACQSTYTAGGVSSATTLTGLLGLISASVVAFVLS